MVLGAFGCKNNTDFDKELVNEILHILSIFRPQSGHMAPTSMHFYSDEDLPLKSYEWSIACNSSVHPIRDDSLLTT